MSFAAAPDKGSFAVRGARIYHRRRPEYWYGVAWLPVFWVTVVLGMGSLVIKLERGDEALELEPTISLRREGWSRGSRIEMGRLSEARLDNLTAGSYEVSGYAVGMAGLEGEVEVRVGEESELRLMVVPAVLVRFEVWYPRDWAGGKATMSIVGEDGTVLWESQRTHSVPPRPFEHGAYVPRGLWTVQVNAENGLSGTSQFSVDSLDREYPVVRVDPK